jgi:hypothetical protein
MLVRLCCAVVAISGLAVGLPSPIEDQWAEASSLRTNVNFINNDDIQNVLPVPPASYPEALQGMIWMDQVGAYAFSNISGGAPDLALSFGDTNYSTLKGNSVNVDIFGPAWQWQNSAAGIEDYIGLQQSIDGTLPFPMDHYEFAFSDDYEFAQIYPCYGLPDGSSARTPKEMMSFSMVRQHPAEGECPPAAGASKQDIAKCAKWRRDSVQGGIKVVYYVFEIVDSNRQPIQPYYDAFLEFANSKCIPDKAAAQKYGFDTSQAVDGADGTQPGTSFLGV